MYIHQGPLINRLLTILNWISSERRFEDLRAFVSTQHVIIGGNLLLADLYNLDHPDWDTHAICSHNERQLYNGILRFRYEVIVVRQLSNRPFAHWIYYRSATDQRQGFGIDYISTPHEYLTKLLSSTS
jgi:hypothetical protein